MVAPPPPEGGQGNPAHHCGRQQQPSSFCFSPRSLNLPLRHAHASLQWVQLCSPGGQPRSVQLPVRTPFTNPPLPHCSSSRSLLQSPRTLAAVPATARMAGARDHATTLLQTVGSVRKLQSVVPYPSFACNAETCETAVPAVTTPKDFRAPAQRSFSFACTASVAEHPGRALAQCSMSGSQNVSLGNCPAASAGSGNSPVSGQPKQDIRPCSVQRSKSAVAPAAERDECLHAQPSHAPIAMPICGQLTTGVDPPANQERTPAKPWPPGAKLIDSGGPSADHDGVILPTEEAGIENVVPLEEAVTPEEHAQKPRKSICVATPSPRPLCRKNSRSRRSSSPGFICSPGRSSCYPRVGPIGSPLVHRRSGCCEKAVFAINPAKESAQRMVHCSGEAATVPERLLLQWMDKRHDTDGLCQEEEDLVRGMFYETMPFDQAKLVRVDRTAQPELISEFCKEELESMARERENQRKHREFMFLHGTRWENVPLICSTGLDPDCGHLSKGSWLGQNAESAHSYAAKGPGPGPFHDGHRLFAMFVVACLPNYADGDEERSFGVWRIMSNKRMCPAYLIIYSAPLNMRASKRSKSKSRLPSPEAPQPSCQQPCKTL
eukprot:TRINITY_DN26870_c0_g1_i1.p1 TRINITY_DN26870_c0_g1~~TRINITY_DN26870_c0_g1_i1.p1  ORF type:complete len:606 (+),score=46.49 TRINITY_DN26870_c0_g1_i1:59-1876(+)